MSNIYIFIYKDYCEFINKPKKMLPILVSVILPLMGFYLDDGIIKDKQCLAYLMTLLVPIYISMETTLIQTSSYIKEGIFEQIFINPRIKKYHIVLAKWFTNGIFTIAAIMVAWIVSMVVNVDYRLDLSTILCLIMTSYLSSSIGIISATIIKSEKSFVLYLLTLILIIVPVFVVFDKLCVFSNMVLLLYLALLSLVGTYVSNCLFKGSRFINRDH